ncbi:RsmF rRNA methyltransferase first C-terminal domain-containing protein [Anaeromicropila populeti]|uniref:NOL1/NOP2/sun family putative RNA methylase n=1 Tax=Anaeromicropila populeti TaxID=37658 RepID=A0A1I6KXX6_9FIRM|nr:RsmB/NOP family class I SAM-dependent RNA methyltransferase [Anaeromicropila populeti]SFR96093.1 NOL1/NOP2/sun family putative RNA methylase [Anaeromicropila populeti]
MKLPQSYLDRMNTLLGEEFEDYLDSFSKPSYAGLRVNTLKITKEDFEKISPFALEPVPWIQNGFYYNKKEQPGKHPFYYGGLYYIQEPSAMTPASLLPVEPGDKVLDLCAAPGGKSTELAAKLQGQGVLISNDISSSRAKALLKNIEVFGVTNGAVLSESPERLCKVFPEYFDKILIDAPCSGEGMFRKDPAIIKSWEKQGPEFFHKIQLSILDAAVKMLKPGGTMLYSTCTFSPLENEGSIEYLLKNYPDFQVEEIPFRDGFDKGRPEWILSERKELEKTVRLWPHKIKGEGHFIAMVRKDGGQDVSVKREVIRKEKCPKQLEDFFTHVTWNMRDRHYEIFGEKVYLVPDAIPDLKGMRILRKGLYLGELKKDRFEPGQSLAMALKKEEYDQCINFSWTDINLTKYLKGETIEIEDESLAGWQLLLVEGYPVGWGKASKGRLKNKYLPGWRLF